MDRSSHDVFTERLSLTVMGMVAGMSPVVHLCGSRILERHPRLRFVIVEAEMGWLAWAPQAMDAMAHKRKGHLSTLRLPLLPSDSFRRQGWITFTDDELGLAQRHLLWRNASSLYGLDAEPILTDRSRYGATIRREPTHRSSHPQASLRG